MHDKIYIAKLKRKEQRDFLGVVPQNYLNQETTPLMITNNLSWSNPVVELVKPTFIQQRISYSIYEDCCSV